MSAKPIAAAAAILTLAPGCGDGGEASSRRAATPPAAGVECPEVAAAKPPSGVTARNRTMFDQLLKLPPPPGPDQAPAVQVVLSVKCLGPKATIAKHKHPWQRYVYLASGSLTVTWEAPVPQVKTFQAGDLLVEGTDIWHSAKVGDDAPAKLIVIDQLPATAPPTSNSIPWTDPGGKAPAPAR